MGNSDAGTNRVSSAARRAPKVLFATAELRPLVGAGGLGEAAAGLTAALRDAGTDVVVALPDYNRAKLTGSKSVSLDVPDWAAPASARVGTHPQAGTVALVAVPGIERPNPYVDETGAGWPDNDTRFAAFSAALAPLAHELGADIVHLNDWHTAFAPPFLPDDLPTVLTIHNLEHQGWAHGAWLHRMPKFREAYRWADGVNMLAGAVSSVSRVTTVSPTYAEEIAVAPAGMGLQDRFALAPGGLVGIRNGIDTRTWDPATDEHTPRFEGSDMTGKATARAELLDFVGWDDTGEPIIVMVTRLVAQKGVDLAFEAARFLEGMRCRLVVLGSGERRLADWGRWLMDQQPDRFWFLDGYDVPLSHLLFAGGDLLLMPSRFEPCGLAQMQAMAYGTIPVVTGVGGLADTVIDADLDGSGNGFVARTVDESGVVDVMHRALRAVRHAGRRKAIQRRGMSADWSWNEPAVEYGRLYEELAAP